MLPPIVLLLALVVVIITALVGLVRGFKRFYPTLIVVVGCVVVALIATKILKNVAEEAVVVYVHGAMEGILKPETLEAIPTAASFIDALPAALVAPFIFSVSYGVILIVVEIIRAIVTAIVRSARNKTGSGLDANPQDKKAKRNNKLLGLGAGILAGLVVAFAFFLPFIGYLGMLSDAVDDLNEVSPEIMVGMFEDEGSQELYAGYIEPILNDPYVNISYKIGGKAVFNAVASVTIDGENYPFTQLLSTGIGVYGNITPFMNAKMADYGEVQIRAINSLVANIEEDILLTNVCAEFISGLATAWENDQAFMGIQAPAAGGSFTPVVRKLVSGFTSTDSEDFIDDLHVVSDIASTMIKHDAFTLLGKGGGDVLSVLSTPGLITELCSAVQKSERTEPVFFEIAKLGVVLISDAIGIPNDSDEIAADQLDTNRVTIQQIVGQLRETPPTDAEGESQKFEKVVSSAVLVMNSLNGEDTNPLFNLDAQAIEDVIVTLSTTETFGDSVALLFKGICQSDLFSATGFSGDDIYRDIMESGYDNIANLLDTVKHTAKMLAVLSESKDNPDNDESGKTGIEGEIQWLISNMTPETSQIIINQITGETIKNLGVSDKSAASVSSFMSGMFTAMVNESDLSEAECKAESDAISHVFAIATELTSNKDGGAVFDDKLSSATDIAQTVLNSKVVSNALISTAFGDDGELKKDPLAIDVKLNRNDRTDLVSALNAYSTANLPTADDAEKEKQKISALATVFNINVDIEADGTVHYKNW